LKVERLDKLVILGSAADYDVCGYCGGRGFRRSQNSPWRFINRAALPGGGSVSLFKVLLTNLCVNDCAYCVNQVGLDGPRSSFLPEELARLFMELYRRRLVQGLFLSSGTGVDADATMESMLKTVELLRHQYEFKGYIHLKILPGASFQYAEAGCKLATRVSVNIEAPTAEHLARLSSAKDLESGILEPMRWVKKIMSTSELLVPGGQSTQFVVGAAAETDRDILRTTAALYREMKLRRVYYSAFRPVRGSRLEGLAPTPPLREHRLYQIDWLLRVYGFRPQEVELALGGEGNLSLTKDPKLVIAHKQPWLFPLDVNRASYEELLRVPGIGPVTARRIVEARREHSIFSLEQLQKTGVVTRLAARFIWFQGALPGEVQTSFLPLLEPDEPAQREPSVAQVVG